MSENDAVTDDPTNQPSRRASIVIVSGAVVGVVVMGILTFLAGPIGFFVAMGLFVSVVTVALAVQRRGRTR